MLRLHPRPTRHDKSVATHETPWKHRGILLSRLNSVADRLPPRTAAIRRQQRLREVVDFPPMRSRVTSARTRRWKECCNANGGRLRTIAYSADIPLWRGHEAWRHAKIRNRK